MPTPPLRSIKQDNLRLHRQTIPGATYAIVKNAGDLYRPIIPDPYQRLWHAVECRIISDTIIWLAEHQRWHPITYVIMPDHIHILFELGLTHTLGSVMASFSKYTTREINRLNGWRGAFWQPCYYDRRIRTLQEYVNQVRYVRRNPVRKGYVKQFEDWPYGWCADGFRRSEIAGYV